MTISAPVAECLCCGHIHTLAVWRDGTNVGVCRSCRDAALSLRGPCSTERGCLCQPRPPMLRAVSDAC